MTNTQQFIEALESAGYEPRGYSGRCMYGKQCVAIVTDDHAFKVGIFVMASLPEDFDTYILESVDQDSMGCSTVIYWPDAEWNEVDEYEEE